MYLNLTIKDVVCYRSKTSYDAEVQISYFPDNRAGEVKTQRLIQKNLPTHEAALKVAEDYIKQLTENLNLTLAFKISSLKVAQE